MLAAVLAAPGCGPDNGLTLGKVRGTVTYKGQPLHVGEISFLPDDGRGNSGVPAMSPINGDGTYTLTTDTPGDGAIVGFHKVAILSLEADPVPAPVAAPPPGGKEVSERGLAKGAATKVKQPAKGPKLFRRRENYFRAVTPEALSSPYTSGISVEVKRGSNRFNFAIQADGSVKVE